MTQEFEDIRIVSMDEGSSHWPNPRVTMYNIVLNLSGSASYEWATYFNQRWEQHIYMGKASARVSGRKLQIYCVPDELEKEHMHELNKIIFETNNAYRIFLTARIQQEATRKAQEIAERDKLKSIKNKLNF